MAAPSELLVLDGPTGTELERRGLSLPAPAWSARAVAEAPQLLVAIHRDYAEAGADVHTAATFRTTQRALRGTPHAADWAALARRAVELVRLGAGAGARVAGSLAPLEDCFAPELVPDDETLAREHAALAAVLADAGADLLLVETMGTLRELEAAVRAATATGLPVWAALTPGPRGDYFTPAALVAAHGLCARLGVEVFLLDCAPADRLLALLTAAFPAGAPAAGPRLGAYGNDLFDSPGSWTPERYARQAERWIGAGVTVAGGCCGTGPEHIRRLAALRDGR